MSGASGSGKRRTKTKEGSTASERKERTREKKDRSEKPQEKPAPSVCSHCKNL